MLARFAPKVFFVLGCLFVSLNVDAQEKEAAKANDKPVPVLIDSMIRGDGEIRSAKFDRFLIELANRTNSKGFVLIYCGKKCQYGEVEAHIRGIESKIGNHWERENILILHAGFKDVMTVELWLMPAGACPPVPTPTVNIKEVKFNGLRKSRVEPYDCCD